MLGKTAGKRLNKYISTYVVFDLETTGISPRADKVIEISALKVKDGTLTEEFSTLVNPGIPIPYGASRINGITDDMVRDAQTLQEVMPDFIRFIEDLVLVGHNIHAFDMKFIYRDSLQFFDKLPDNDYVDTLYLARNCLPQLSHHTLVDLAKYYNISSVGAHRALNDCRMNQQVFECLAKELTPQKLKLSGGRICARCKSPMKKRNGRYGEFWGCSSYPQCRYTEPL